jgi:hypothetical protein
MSLADWEIELLNAGTDWPNIYRETSMYEFMQMNVSEQQQRIAEGINDGIIKQKVFDDFRAEVRNVLLKSGYVPRTVRVTGVPV